MDRPTERERERGIENKRKNTIETDRERDTYRKTG